MRQTVFKSQSQVLELRELFYGDQTTQKRALALCRAYETRHRLPVSVHLTALVTAAMHADCQANDLYAVRLGYSAALIRVVNEVLDSAQQGKVAAPLHALALMVDLPSSFVEVRHAATHEELPSVDVLRELTRRALHWLDEHFWRLQVAHAPKIVKGDTKELFSLWRRSRRADVAAPLTSEQRAIARSLRLKHAENKREFLKVLTEKNILVPQNGKVQLAMTMWTPCFEHIGSDEIVVELVHHLNAQEWTPGEASDLKAEALSMWVDHFIAALKSPNPPLLGELGSKPRPWNAKGLAAYARKFGDADVQVKAEKMAKFTGTEISNGSKVEASASELRTEKKQRRSKWNTVPNWTPRPLGV